MLSPHSKKLSEFTVVGINHKHTDTTLRSKFAISDEQYSRLLARASSFGIDEMFVISTCNRTEIIGFADAGDLINLLCTETSGRAVLFSKHAYVLTGLKAVQHLFEVGAGLDSQILGDYEIIGQLKKAIRLPKEKGFIGTFTERLINHVLQASKSIKNETALSSGSVSVAFSAIQYIRLNVENYAGKNILLVGAGKIGQNTVKNIIQHLETRNITIVNRTAEKARSFADVNHLSFAEFQHLTEEVKKADIIIIATESPVPVITADMVTSGRKQLFIDLSIPCNVASEVAQIDQITVVNVDELSGIKDDTLKKRKAEVPKALQIISTHLAAFVEWQDLRKHVPVLTSLKSKLQELRTNKAETEILKANQYSTDQHIQKVINGTASKLKVTYHPGCHYIQAINEFMATGTD